MPRDCSAMKAVSASRSWLLIGKGRGVLVAHAAEIDALFEVDGLPEHLVVGRITRRHALHAAARVTVAIGAGLARCACLAIPQRFAVEHPQHAGIGRVVILHRLGIGRHERVTGPALGWRDLGRDQGTKDDAGHEQQRRQGNRECYRCCNLHSTEMLAEAFSEKPLSPIHSKSNFPLLVATVKKEMNGLAAVAGKKSARKISSPSKRQVKLVMILRGTMLPDVVRR